MLISEIVKNNLCVGCGVCTSENKTNEKFYEMRFNDNGFLVPYIINLDKEEPKEAINVCPFGDTIQNNEDTLSKEFFESKKADKRIGNYVNTFIGYSNKYRETSSSGGIATYVFGYLLNKKIVDYIYIVKENESGYVYQVFDNVNEIKKTSKTRYYPVTLEKLFDDIDNVNGKIAITGVACFIKAIRLKQLHNPELRNKIPFLVGIICGGLKSKYYTDFLAINAGIQNEYLNQDYRIKDYDQYASAYSFGALDAKNNEFKTMKMKKVGDMWGSGLFKSNACDFCSDVTTELADISLGDAWLKPYVEDGRGNNVIITRNKLANDIIVEGLKSGELKLEEVHKNKIIQSQKSSFIHRQIGLKYRIKKNKLQSRITVRERLLESIPFEYKLVQNYRSLIREFSLSNWILKKEKETYMVEIKKKQIKLKKVTKFYHRVQKVKRILKLNNLNNNV